MALIWQPIFKNFLRCPVVYVAPNLIKMPVDQERRRVTFRKLDRQLAKLGKKPSPESIHKFRTYSRRIEVLLDELVADPGRNEKKLVKLLGRTRKKAGHVRDLDVQIALLRNLKFPQDMGRKSQLLAALTEERVRRETKLEHEFEHKAIREVQRRLKRSAADMSAAKSVEPLAVAVRKLSDLVRDNSMVTEKRLHQYRIVGKRVRYLAEFAGKGLETEHFVEQLKLVQDVIGDWHDWLKLTQHAEELLGGARNSSLVAMLRNITQAKFRQAVSSLTGWKSIAATERPTLFGATSRTKTTPPAGTAPAAA